MNENREYEQQQFIESVVAALHRATHDDGAEYVRKFAMLIALCMIEATKTEGEVLAHGGFPAVRMMFEEHVLEPMRMFAKDDIERRLIFGQLAEKLLTGSVMPALYGAAARQEFEQRCTT